MTQEMIPDADLDGLFAEARTAGPLPSAGLQARVMDDAHRLQGEGRAVAQQPDRGNGMGAGLFWAGLLALFGGPGVMAGAVTAGLAGLAVGYLQPASLDGLSGYLSLQSSTSVAATEELELMPGLDALLATE